MTPYAGTARSGCGLSTSRSGAWTGTGWSRSSWAFLAVIVLNASARALANDTDDLVLAISDGLQVVSWVTLWFPVNLLVYDRGGTTGGSTRCTGVLEGMEITWRRTTVLARARLAGRSTER